MMVASGEERINKPAAGRNYSDYCFVVSPLQMLASGSEANVPFVTLGETMGRDAQSRRDGRRRLRRVQSRGLTSVAALRV